VKGPQKRFVKKKKRRQTLRKRGRANQKRKKTNKREALPRKRMDFHFGGARGKCQQEKREGGGVWRDGKRVV